MDLEYKSSAPTRTTWGHGDKVRIAKRCRITKGHLNNVLHGFRNVDMEKALEIVRVARSIGLNLHVSDLLWPDKSENPLVTRYLAKREKATQTPA